MIRVGIVACFGLILIANVVGWWMQPWARFWFGQQGAAGVATLPLTAPVVDTAPVPVTQPAPPDQAVAQRIIDAARSWLSVPYLWGGCTRSGVDCSCFVRNVLATVGINAPRTTVEQVRWAHRIVLADARVGDLLFFNDTCTGCGANPTHVGLVVGDGVMIDAGDPVKQERFDTPYWRAHYASAGRPPGL